MPELNYSMYNNPMKVEFDNAERDKTPAERGLDFSRAGVVFVRGQFTAQDLRAGYGEPRFFAVGHLDHRLVIGVWTPPGEVRRITV